MLHMNEYVDLLRLRQTYQFSLESRSNTKIKLKKVTRGF